MPGAKRVTRDGMVFHALNRGVGKTRIFSTERDSSAFEGTIEETLWLYPMRILVGKDNGGVALGKSSAAGAPCPRAAAARLAARGSWKLDGHC